MYTTFTAEPFRHWESEDTRIRYPIAWDITIPEMRAALTFEPLADNQEIPIVGLMRAIWEGAGTVSGMLAGKTIKGWARLELHGYGYIFDFQKYSTTAPLVKKSKTASSVSCPGRSARRTSVNIRGLHHGVRRHRHIQPYFRSRYGPRLAARETWRTSFRLPHDRSLGVAFEPYEMLLSVIPELCHTGALIVDDIEDGSLMRRGADCVHVRYGLDVALNAANTVYFLPYLLLAVTPFFLLLSVLICTTSRSKRWCAPTWGRGWTSTGRRKPERLEPAAVAQRRAEAEDPPDV